ncbi:5'-methylthioadenosine/S-adenosylhomocysteine nucleosidase [Sphingomonas hylomeconis]|uniref:5'-methylthioadenosine/S-adenosylhomocysteine nucleosidase n=1 Tax=Sphingomonas hylomeconis TaxID=1395958 RepID=A0ABV7STZ6_9SPHN|nr:5'-methylthioadenosine/S-adenosylhomocysteine nucleosidase [Sphingomonas hylomeconis]
MTIAHKLDSVPRIAVMTAFPPEWAALVDSVEDAAEHRVNGLTILTGTLAGKAVVLMQSGISMVNAAMNTQLLIDRFAVSAIVFSGIAGGVDPGLSVGDVCVPARWGQNGEVAIARQVASGFAPPTGLPGGTDLPGHGALFPRDVLVGNADDPVAERRWLMADPDLVALAATVGATLMLDRHLPGDSGFHLPHQPRIVTGGNAVSGPAFVDNIAYREYLAAVYSARVVDMESAAVAHVAYANSVGFVIFRSVSDLAGADSGDNQMLTFMTLAATNSAHLVRAFVAAMPA